MLDAIKKGLIQTAYLSAWCSHAEEYGGREHGIYGGCRIEEMAPEVPYSEMADMADRVLSRLASAFVADAVFRVAGFSGPIHRLLKPFDGCEAVRAENSVPTKADASRDSTRSAMSAISE
jgi:hypothetical protein